MATPRPFLLALAALTLAALSLIPGAADASRFRALRHVGTGAPGFPFVTPGATALGSWAATAQPADMGVSTNFFGTEPPIAAWDLPDYQDLNTTTSLCVYAKHGSGIDHVDIAVQGGSFVTAPLTSQSPNGPEPAYCVNLDPSAFATDQNWEARARIYPVDGKVLVLQGPGRNLTTSIASLYGTANSRGQLFRGTWSVYTTGTDSPSCGTSGGATGACLTIDQAVHNAKTAGGGDVGGATICTGPNSALDFRASVSGGATGAHRMMTIQPCVGVTKAQVTIVSADNTFGVSADKLHLAHVNWASSAAAPSTLNVFGMTAFLEDVTYQGRGKGLNDNFLSSSGTVFGRDVEITGTGDGFNNCALGVRIKVHDIDSDVFSGCYAVFEPPGDPTYVYHVDDRYTPPGSTSWITGNTHGTTLVDGIADTSLFSVPSGGQPGSQVFDAPGYSACFPNDAGGVPRTVVSKTANSITLDRAVTCTETGAFLMTGNHPDVDQNGEIYLHGTGTAGASTFTLVSGTPYPGTLIWDETADDPTTPDAPATNTVFTPFTKVVSYDSGTGLVTLSKPILKSFTSADLLPQGRHNLVFYGLYAVNWVSAQGVFQGPDMADYVFDNSTINNRVTPALAGDPPYNWHTGGHWKNVIFDNSHFIGPSASAVFGEDFLIRNTSCTSIVALSHTGMTYSGDTSCKYP